MGIFNILASPDSSGLKQPIIELYFELETVLKVYNLEARF